MVVIPGGALRSGRIDEHAIGGHAQRILANARVVVRIDGGGVARAAEPQQRETGIQRRREIRDEVERQHRRKFLGRERMLLADAAHLRANDRSIGWDLEAGHLGDLGGRLADALRIHGPVRRDQQFAERLLLSVVTEVRLAGFEEGKDAVPHGSSATMACSLEQTVP